MLKAKVEFKNEHLILVYKCAKICVYAYKLCAVIV